MLILPFLAFASSVDASTAGKRELVALPLISTTDSVGITAVGIVGHLLHSALSLNSPLFSRPRSLLQLELFSLLLISQYYYIKLAHSFRMPFEVSFRIANMVAVLYLVHGMVASGEVGGSVVKAVINVFVMTMVGCFGKSAEWNRWIVVLAACLIGSSLGSFM